MKRVLIIQIRQLGDILLSTPLCRALKENLSSVEVHFLTSEIGKSIVLGNPYIDKILTLSEGIVGEVRAVLTTLRNRYDAVIDVQRTGRSRRITLFSLSPRRIAFKKKNFEIGYNIPIEWENRGYTAWERIKLLEGLGVKVRNYQDYLPEFYNFKPVKNLKLDKYAVIVPTARKREKMWEVKNFQEIISFIHRKFGIKTVLLYGKGEEEEIKKYKNLQGTIIPERALSIGESASVIKGALFFIGLNSFASHLSVSVGTKTIVIDKKHSGWFPPISLVKEVYGDGTFPNVDSVKKAILELMG